MNLERGAQVSADTPTKSGSYKLPTMRDIANAAGVSLSTVSLVVNGKPGVSPERRELILETIKKLGYVFDGRMKGSTHTRILGLLMESLSEASRSEGFYTRVVSGIEETAYQLGYQVMLHVFRPDIDPIHSIRELMGRDIDGLIIANDGAVTSDIIRKITSAGRPIVLVENYQPDLIHSVTADNFTAGRIMTEHLIELGHKRIGSLIGPAKYSSLRDRLRGYKTAMIEHGLALDPALQPEPVSGNPRKGYVQMQQLLTLSDPPTAVFAVSDRAAFGAMDAIKDAGLHIPCDISIVGIDDVRDSAYSSPPLTTYRVPKYELGRTAVLILHDLIARHDLSPSRTVLLGQIEIRQSTAPPRA